MERSNRYHPFNNWVHTYVHCNWHILVGFCGGGGAPLEGHWRAHLALACRPSKEIRAICSCLCDSLSSGKRLAMDYPRWSCQEHPGQLWLWWSYLSKALTAALDCLLDCRSASSLELPRTVFNEQQAIKYSVGTYNSANPTRLLFSLEVHTCMYVCRV